MGLHNPFDGRGRFIAKRCQDPNCDGELVKEDYRYWRCNGLTHLTDTSALYDCRRAHIDGEAKS